MSDAAGGRKLPTLAVTLAYVRACDGDAAEWERAWHALAAELAAENTEPGEQETTDDVPYVGLGAFRVEDADRFFGRERVLDELDGKLAHHRFLTVFGPSGAGKSSLLRAGFVPRRADSAVVLFSPGRHPFEECALQLAPLLGTTAAQVLDELRSAPDNLRLLLRQAGPDGATVVVDQFEELFTLCTDPVERTAFLDALLTAASGTTEVVLGVRADFYPRCAEHRGLADAVADAQLLLGPMTAAELRDAIVKPATRAGLSVEGALVTELVAEAHAQPGVLPLLSHALLETWRRRRGATLALSGYHATGGIRGALANTAETEYSSLDKAEQATAQQLFLRLIDPGEDTCATKRRLRRDELDQDDPQVEAVLNRLAASRLITLDADTVELTHEAVIDAWPRLRDWLAENRDGLRVHRQLTDAATTWEQTNREPDALARGTRLAVARDWAETGHATMTPREREFLQASLDAELAAQRRTQRRARQLRWLSAALAVLLVFALGMTWDARNSQQTATEQQHIALSRQLAAQADAIADQNTGQAIRLSLESAGAVETAETRSSLLSAAGHPVMHGLLPARVPLALSDDGASLASQESDGIVIWNVPHRKRDVLLVPSEGAGAGSGEATDAAFDKNRGRLVTVTSSGRLDLWDLHTSKHLAAVATGSTSIFDVAFSPDGTRIGTIDSHQELSLWNAETLTLVYRLSGDSAVQNAAALAFTPDGRGLLTTIGYDRAVLRDAATGMPQAQFPGSSVGLRPVAVDPAGARFAIPDGESQVKIWDATTHQVITRLPNTGDVDTLAFIDRRTLLVTNAGRGITIWNVDQQQPVVLSDQRANAVLTAAGTVVAGGRAGTWIWDLTKLPLRTDGVREALAFTDDGRSLLVAGQTAPNGAQLQKWRLTDRAHDDLMTTPQPDNGHYAFSRDGARLAVLDPDHGLTIHDVVGFTPPVTLSTATGLTSSSMSFSPNGAQLAAAIMPAVGSHNGTEHTVVWDIADRHLVADLPVTALHLAYSPDGRHLAIDDGTRLRIWDLTTSSPVSALPRGPEPLNALTYSPDGSMLAIARGNATVTVWDIAQDQHVTDLATSATSAGLLTFSPTGRFLVTGSGEKLVVWQVAGWERWATLTGSSANVTGSAWSPDEKVLATAALDGTVTLWPVDLVQATTQLCTTLARDFPANALPAPATCAPEGNS
ncbi:nSTAND1 domain-containing NTPase [Amycolatopsis plumensis]|uniref:Novel STAND NTPase 1 domain-containing protein n=1 Tax=Amycolatopsis plumensis TaxID=236508 RepID=A0ABV5U0D5_9PSEU